MLGLFLCVITVTGVFAIMINGLMEDVKNSVSINVIQEIPSPSGELKLVKYTKDVNITAETSYNLSVIKNNNGNKGIDVVQFVTDKDFAVEWNSDEEVTVYAAKDAGTYKNDESVKIGKLNVKIKYE